MDAAKVNTASAVIKQKAKDLGFDICGIARARVLKEREKILGDWCAAGMNSDMNYLERDMDKRIDPRLHVENAKSVIVSGLNYFSDDKQVEKDVPVISRYAYGEQYQNVIKKKLKEILGLITTIIPGTTGKVFSDTAPLLEKAWAVEAGLGWQGRHSVVINKKIGSFFFLGIIIVDAELDYDEPFSGNHCGNCRICIESCPTGAINENGTIDARKCIANLTIENRKPIPDDIVPKMGMRIYGCDRCQEVCPWNKNAKQNSNPEFRLSEEVKYMSREEWIALTREQFNCLFKKTPVGRRKYEPLMKNVEILTREGIVSH